jgi:FimV-like protein
VAFELQPDDPALELALARSLLALGDKDRARQHLEHILKADPEQAEAQQLLKSLK